MFQEGDVIDRGLDVAACEVTGDSHFVTPFLQQLAEQGVVDALAVGRIGGKRRGGQSPAVGGIDRWVVGCDMSEGRCVPGQRRFVLPLEFIH